MEHEKLIKSIRPMGEEVIPALRDVQPPVDLPEELAASANTAGAAHTGLLAPPTWS